MSSPRSVRCPLALLVWMIVGAGLVGCDATPGVPPSAPQPPVVSNFTLSPSRVEAADLRPGQIQDGQAQVTIEIGVTAEDPDGAVRRVLFTIAPASTPGRSIQGELVAESGAQYGAAIDVGLPADQDDIYTVRVFAIDDDDQASNQVLGTLRFVPAP